MLSLLTILLACSTSEPPAAAPAEPTDPVASVRQGVQAAHRAWSAGDYDEARAAVMETYATAFAPLEPSLRAADPARTLRLEYRFGLLSQHLGRKGNPVQVATEVREFVAEIESAAGAAVPARGTAVDPTAPAVPATPVTPVTTSIEVKPAVANPEDAVIKSSTHQDEAPAKKGR